jgi:hypothetical protein
LSGIRFPRLHVAESVVNRILNAFDDIQARPSRQGRSAARGEPAALPGSDNPLAEAEDLAPDPTLAGGALDLALAEPVPEVAPDPAVVQGAATGDASPLESLLAPPT